MKKKIWIINHYAGETYFSKGGRHFWFAKYLKQLGYEPIIICSNSMHGNSKVYFQNVKSWNQCIENKYDIPYIFIKARPYTGNGKQRFFNMLDFFERLNKYASDFVKHLGKPDIILASSIHPLAVVSGIRIAKKLGIQCICEYRDLWPDELLSMGVIHDKSIMTIILRQIEYWTYKKADAIIFTMEGGTQYIRDQKWDRDNGGKINISKCFYINNGIDLEEYEANLISEKFDDADLDNKALFKIVYTGTIRKANGIERILDIAEQLRNYRDIRFFLFGQCDDEGWLKEEIRLRKLDSVIYKGRVHKKLIPSILQRSDLNLLNYQNGKLFRYGCSNNKLFDYMASGSMILCTIKMNFSILYKYKCGMEILDETISECVKSILQIYGMSDKERQTYQMNALQAVKDYNMEKLAGDLANIIENI